MSDIDKWALLFIVFGGPQLLCAAFILILAYLRKKGIYKGE